MKFFRFSLVKVRRIGKKIKISEVFLVASGRPDYSSYRNLIRFIETYPLDPITSTVTSRSEKNNKIAWQTEWIIDIWYIKYPLSATSLSPNASIVGTDFVFIMILILKMSIAFCFPAAIHPIFCGDMLPLSISCGNAIIGGNSSPPSATGRGYWYLPVSFPGSGPRDLWLFAMIL